MSAKHVYFMRPLGMDGPIKIGCSVTPAKRLRSLEIWSPIQLELIASAPGDHRHEWLLHQRFGDLRLHGEWFKPSTKMLELIDHVVANGVLPPMVLPSNPDEWRAQRDASKGARPRRNPEAQQCKYKLTTSINNAERHAYGFSDYDYRPAEISEIVAGYQGFASSLPTPAQVAACEAYVAELRAMPKADRSWGAWKAWADARRAGRLSA